MEAKNKAAKFAYDFFEFWWVNLKQILLDLVSNILSAQLNVL